MLTQLLDEMKDILSTRKLLQSRYVQELADLDQAILAATLDNEDLAEAIRLCELCLKEQTDVKQYIEDLVTALYHTVLGPQYEFKYFVTYQKDGVTLSGMKPMIAEYGEWQDPDEYGDAVQLIASVGQRMAFLMLNPHLTNFQAYDEPLKPVKKELWQKIVKFWSDIGRDGNVPFQVFLITHESVEFPKTYTIRKSGKTSKVEEIKHG